MDAIILILIIIILVLLFKRTFSSLIYAIAIVDIFLRIITFIKLNLLKGELYTFVNNYFPASLPSLIDKYSNGIVYSILMWMLLLVYILFEFYIFRTFLKKRWLNV